MQTNTSHLSIGEKLEWLDSRNEEYSNLYQRDAFEREIYFAQHPTALLAFKCMDGRVHIPALTNTPLGIIKPFRRLGGIFDLGWPFLGEKFSDWLLQQAKSGKRSIALITYHFSKGDNEHRGCAGFGCDLEAALRFTASFKTQIERIFDKRSTPIYPVIVGLETDEDGFIFHNNGKKLDMYDALDWPESKIDDRLTELFSDIPREIIRDLMPLVIGNIKHVKEIRSSKRQIIEAAHKEWIVGIGSGFDWLHAPNTALIIGPWSPRADIDIQKAFSIVRANMQEDRIAKDGFVLLVSSEYSDNFQKNIRVEKINFLKNFALDILNQEEFADLKDKVRVLPVLIDERNKKFENVQSLIDKIPYVKWY